MKFGRKFDCDFSKIFDSKPLGFQFCGIGVSLLKRGLAATK